MDEMEAESNNNKPFRRGLENEDSSFTSMRSSLRARRDRLARREAMLKVEDAKGSPKADADRVDSPADPTSSADTTTAAPTRYSSYSSTASTKRRSRLANEYSEPQVTDTDDETALSLISSSKILSMDDSSISPSRAGRGLSATPTPESEAKSIVSELTADNPPQCITGNKTPATTPTEGESGAMSNMRKSLPASMRSRRTRREITIEDMRTRTPSRELINNDINGLVNSYTKPGESPLVNGNINHTDTATSSLPNGETNSGVSTSTALAARRRSYIDETDSSARVTLDSRTYSNTDLNKAGSDRTVEPAGKSSVDRTTSGSTTMSSGAVPGETREERIARYKEMRKAALAARASEYMASEETSSTTPVTTGYVPRYLRNKDTSQGANSENRNRDEDSGSGYIPRWRRKNRDPDDNDMASSSNASSMTDLHVTRKDSSASSDSTDNGPCKLTYENLKLHDKLSSAAAPYSSLSRLEESPTIAPIAVEEISKTLHDDANDDQGYSSKYSSRRKDTADLTPTNSPSLKDRASQFRDMNSTKPSPSAEGDNLHNQSESASRSKTRRTLTDDSNTKPDNQIKSLYTESEKVSTRTENLAEEKSTAVTAAPVGDRPKPADSISDLSEMSSQQGGVRRGSMGLSDRLKKFEGGNNDAATTPSKPAFREPITRPGKLDMSRFSRQSSTDTESKTGKISPTKPVADMVKLHKKFATETDVKTNGDAKVDEDRSNKSPENHAEEVVVERRRPAGVSALLNKKDPRPVSAAFDEPLLDPQLAAMLEARKIKAGENPCSDVTSILKSRMQKQREQTMGPKPTISVAARTSFFKDEQKRVAEIKTNAKPSLDRHPSATIPQIDKKDTEAKRAIGVKRAMLLKKRQRSATQPITVHEVFAAKSADRKHEKTQDDLDLLGSRPFRGRLLSVPTTMIEIREVKNGSAPQKAVRPPPEKKPVKQDRKSSLTPTNKPVKKKSVTSRINSGRTSVVSKVDAGKTMTNGKAETKNVTPKKDSGRSPLSRNTAGRSSLRSRPDPKSSIKDNSSAKGSISSLVDDKNGPPTSVVMRRSASVRVSGNVAKTAAAGIKAAAERANALVEARKKAAEEKKAAEMKRLSTKTSDSMKARAQPRVDSRRTSYASVNGSGKMLNVKVSDNQTSSSTTESCPLSPASTDTTSTTDKLTDSHSSNRPRRLSGSTVNSEDVPSYMRMTAAATRKDRLAPSAVDQEEISPPQPTKRGRSGSLRDLDLGVQPSYMKPTNSFAHRLEAKLDDIATPDEEPEQRTKSKPIDMIELETGARPSFMRPTASSVKKVEKDESEERKPRRVVSPTLPDGDLPSYMKATESYFKKKSGDHEITKHNDKVEHLFDDEIPDETPRSKKASTVIAYDEDNLPSFMKPTKAFEALVSVPVEEPSEHKPKRKSTIPNTNGEIPSYMKTTKSYEVHHSEDHLDGMSPDDRKSKSSSAARLSHRSSPHTSTTHSENGDLPSYMKLTKSVEQKGQSHDMNGSEEAIQHTDKKRPANLNLSNGELPSFMRPTKSFEIRDRHNEEAMLQEQQAEQPEKKHPMKKRISAIDLGQGGEIPSFMKATKSHESREQAIATGAVEPDPLDMTLQTTPLIDRVPEPSPTKRKSVGGFLRKKFGLGKGTSIDSVSSTATSKSSGRKSSITKQSSQATTPTNGSAGKATTPLSPGDTPSYMKSTNSAQRKINDSVFRSMTKSKTKLQKRRSGSVTEDADDMSTATLTAPSMNGGEEKRTPLVKVTQVSIDGKDHEVPMRTKKSSTNNNTAKLGVKSETNSSPKDSSTPRSSLASRLASLQVNGEEGWKRRVGEKDHGSFRSGSIHDRLSKIKDNSESWQKKIGQENDAKQFTMEGKMAKKGEGVKVAPSPLMPRKERTGGAAKRANSLRLQREDGKSPAVAKARPSSAATPKRSEAKVESTVIQVPDMDDAASFFTPTAKREDIEVTDEDFDHIFIESANPLPAITRIKPKRNRASNSPNPLKSLQMRADIRSEYTETKTDVADREMKRISKAKVAENASKTARAGLANKEDLKKVALKKTSHTAVMNPGGMSAAPYRDLMLIQIKGRRHVEMRIVQPSAHSINSGDCFLLVTKSKIYQWMGEYANVMERSKSADLAAYILQKKDLGCTLAKSVTIIEETKQAGLQGSEFWKLLGGNKSYASSGPVEEDELYEDYMAETNCVYRVDDAELTPCEDYSGQIPRYDMLQDEQVLVFDFGTEVYSWCGKLTSMDQRKTGLKLAKLLHQSGYDYSECDINPMSPLTLPDKGGLVKKSATRPDWTICGKVTANMETLLFKEKFFDWPEASRLIQTKDNTQENSSNQAEELKPFDAESMLEKSDKPVTMVLEQSNVGRGQKWVEYEDGLRREYSIDTLAIRMWHVSASDYYELMEDSYGQLHSCDTYVVRWQYQIKQSGVRDLKGNLSKRQAQMGRERCAYFFWQGSQSSINEKGASALMTVELDEENGPQVRVEQGMEPACFLNLFDGHMITHLGRREDDEKKHSSKLYIVQNDHENEAALQEVQCSVESLRSRGVFINAHLRTGTLYLWIGSKSSESLQANGRRIAKWMTERCPMEVGLSLESSVTVTEIKEGRETSDFFTSLGSKNRTEYDCLMNEPSPASHTHIPRLFHMTSVNLTFHVQEVLHPARNEQYSAFPFKQSQLYKQDQPTLYMLDFGEDVFLWHGWWPLGYKEEENVSTGSARARYTEDRKLSLETAINYCKAREGRLPNMYCVYAGMEPLSFTNRFPEWQINQEASDANTQENRPSTLEDMNTCFTQLSKSVYTFEELQQRPLPDGVNPNKLETYLSDEQFMEVLKMTRSEFAALPAWKQTNTRKESKLF